MEEVLTIEALIILLVLVATLVAIAVRRVRLPYTVALVLVGLVITIRRPLDIEMTPELILSLFVPPLIFEAAFHLDLRLLRDTLPSILLLAVPGVLLTTLFVGGVVTIGTGLPFATAVVFGALIAATDPVAVVALFRELGVPRRLAVAVEGESLFNDGTAIVVFRIALLAAVSGVFDPVDGLFDFFQVALGGMAVGLALGWLAAQLIARIDDRLISATLTTLLAYGAYLVAEQLHVSGVLAVVVAGLLTGNLGTAGASPTAKSMIFDLWEYLAFIANSLIFLLIGLDIDLSQLWANLWPIAVAVVAVVVSRAAVVYGLSWLSSLGSDRTRVPLRWRHVLFWGGLRGAISLALALSLPATLPDRDMLESMAFGVMLFTLMGQGTTIQLLLRRLGLIERPEHVIDRERFMGQLLATQAGMRRLDDLRREGILLDKIWQSLHADYVQTRNTLTEEIDQLFADHAELERELLIQARREALQAEQAALMDALRQGLLSDEVFGELRADIDRRLEAMALIQTALQSRQLPREGEGE
jgi:CPA1 family monovalent cation:H+ antiporter